MKVLILQGGYNEEHKVSLNTAKQIGRALKKLKIDFRHFIVNPNTFEKDILKYSNKYICFNALHGSFGEDGAIQKILKKKQISFYSLKSNFINKLEQQRRVFDAFFMVV